MKLLKKIFPWLLLLILGSLAGFVYLLKAPVDPPSTPASAFAVRPKLRSSKATLEVRVLDTGYSDANEALVVHDGAWGRTKHYRHVAFLIRHPKGTLIFDGGLGGSIDQDFLASPWYQRLTPYIKTKSLKELAASSGIAEPIAFFLLSHGHWDHVSGMLDFPEVPIRLLPEELAFIKNPDSIYRRGVFPRHAEAISQRGEALVLEDKPYENFPKSLDLFGDQSLVAVALPGHTPGSLGLFINFSGGERFLLLGDAVHGIHEDGSPEARTKLMESVSDLDPTQARITRHHLDELIAHSNEVKLVPTHEPDQLENFLKTTKP